MRILGIDPGSRTTGYGVVEQLGNRLIHVTHGQINTTHVETLPLRLKVIHDRLMEVIAATSPDAVAVEEIFVNNNPRSAIKLGQARGVALLVGVLTDRPVFEYSALQVKSSVVGYGKADKKQVQQMVKMLLNLAKTAPADASDALAIAICHTHRHATLRRATSSPMEAP